MFWERKKPNQAETKEDLKIGITARCIWKIVHSHSFSFWNIVIIILRQVHFEKIRIVKILKKRNRNGIWTEMEKEWKRNRNSISRGIYKILTLFFKVAIVKFGRETFDCYLKGFDQGNKKIASNSCSDSKGNEQAVISFREFRETPSGKDQSFGPSKFKGLHSTKLLTQEHFISTSSGIYIRIWSGRNQVAPYTIPRA